MKFLQSIGGRLYIEIIPNSPRPGPDFEGSAQWAYKIAQNIIGNFSSDAELYGIVGEKVFRDGRLSENIGSWSFILWSPSEKKILEVTVDEKGVATNTTRNEVSPTPPVEQPIHSGWVNSTDIFKTATKYMPHQIGVTFAYSAALNIGNDPNAPDEAVWNVNFKKNSSRLQPHIIEDEAIIRNIESLLVKTPLIVHGNMHRIMWDGTYIDQVDNVYRLISPFLKRDPNAHRIIGGVDYNMDDPGWIINMSDLNKEVFAYKILSAFHMLGYNTSMDRGETKPQLRILNKLQTRYGQPAGTLLNSLIFEKLDSSLVQKESRIQRTATNFPLYDHMQPLHRNAISKDFLAYIYYLPMMVLPGYLQMAKYETVQAIAGQCLGGIQDENGNDWPTFPVDTSKDYRFVGAYFDPNFTSSILPSAAVCVNTVLHEYAHYLDGHIYSNPKPNQPLMGKIDTMNFNDISFDMSTNDKMGCVYRKTNDIKDFISRYGYLSHYGCDPDKYVPYEEFAEAFMMYVVAGERFRAAAQQNNTIMQKYDWLKNNVFKGTEYETDLISDLNSGCNDVQGYQQQEPGYASCSVEYVWNGDLIKK